MPHKFDPAHVERLLSAERDRDVAPEKLLREAGLEKGDAFADIGCGPGFFSIPAAGIVGEEGVVYAVDSEEKMLERLRLRCPPANVIVLKSAESAIPLKDSSVDFAFLGYMLHETEDRAIFLKDVKRILKDGAKVLVLDWKKKREENGPPFEERITEEEVIGVMKAAGFEDVKASALNESHYSITAVKGRQ